MFCIVYFRNHFGIGSLDNIERLYTLAEGIPTRDAAAHQAELMTQGAEAAGFNQEKDYFWCRREGFDRTEIFAVRREPDLNPRLG